MGAVSSMQPPEGSVAGFMHGRAAPGYHAGMDRLRIATRKSPLALLQAGLVQSALLQEHPGLQVELVGLLTSGDRGRVAENAKALYTHELEVALRDGRVELAVHSMKDVPVAMSGLVIGAYLHRGPVGDVLVGQGLAEGIVVGTSSLRRQCQLLARHDVRVVPVHGNVGTRLSRLDSGDMDALVLAEAGLVRLGHAGRITERLDPMQMIPAIGQGAIGVQLCEDQTALLEVLAAVDDRQTRLCVEAERACSYQLGGDCRLPIAAHAELRTGRLWMEGMVGLPDGSQVVRAGVHDAAPAEAGLLLAECLRAAGAEQVLARLRG